MSGVVRRKCCICNELSETTVTVPMNEADARRWFSIVGCQFPSDFESICRSLHFCARHFEPASISITEKGKRRLKDLEPTPPRPVQTRPLSSTPSRPTLRLIRNPQSTTPSRSFTTLAINSPIQNLPIPTTEPPQSNLSSQSIASTFNMLIQDPLTTNLPTGKLVDLL